MEFKANEFLSIKITRIHFSLKYRSNIPMDFKPFLYRMEWTISPLNVIYINKVFSMIRGISPPFEHILEKMKSNNFLV